MALFTTDIEALIYILIIGAILVILIRLISFLLNRTKKISNKNVNIIKFAIRVINILIMAYLLIEGFPSFSIIDPAYSAILTGSISTALAFVSSEIFSNFMAGLLLFIIDPFDIGDVVKIKGYKGVIISSTLTRVVLETFDQIKVDIANNDLITSNIVNYSLKLTNNKSFYRFKKLVQIPQYKGKSHLDGSLFQSKDESEKELKDFHDIVVKKDLNLIHAYTFNMMYPYKKLRIKIDETDKLCLKFKEKFGFKPRFHIIGYDSNIKIKFRILTLTSKSLIDHLPEFAKELYKIILKKND